MANKHKTEFERVVMEGLEKAGKSKEWLCDKLDITVTTLYSWFKAGYVTPGNKYYIGRLLDIPQFFESDAGGE